MYKFLPKKTEICPVFSLPQGKETGKYFSHKHWDHTFDHLVMGLVVLSS